MNLLIQDSLHQDEDKNCITLNYIQRNDSQPNDLKKCLRIGYWVEEEDPNMKERYFYNVTFMFSFCNEIEARIVTPIELIKTDLHEPK